MKMKRDNFKKFLSAFLAMTLVVASVSGCGKKKTQEDSLVDQATRNSKDYVFAMELLDITEDQQDISRLSYAGDRCYASTYGADGKLEIYSFNSDGSDVRNTVIPCAENENYSYMSFDNDGNSYAICNIYQWDDEDGEMHVFEEGAVAEGEEISESTGESEDAASEETSQEDKESQEESSEGTSNDETAEKSEEGEEGLATPDEKESVTDEEESLDVENGKMIQESENDETYLTKYDSDGKEIYKIDLVKEFGDENGYVTVNSMTVTDDGKVIICLESGIYSYDEGTSSFKPLVSGEEASKYSYCQIYKGFGGKLFISSYGESGVELRSFDPESGKMGDPSSVINGYVDVSFFGGNGYDLYMSKSDGIYGLDMAKDSATKLLDFVDSDIEVTSSIDRVIAISDAEFVALLADSDYNSFIARLTKVPADQVKDKKILTMGGYYIDYDIRKQAFEFNKNNSDYKIKFIDYSSYDESGEYGAGIEKMNMDIISGNTPDIMILSDSMPVSSYINKGLFTDVSSYINNDPELNNELFLTNVMDALRTGDKLYQVVPSFYVGTVAMKTKFTDGKNVLSIKDCKNLMDNMGVKADAAFGIMPRDSFLEQGLSFAGDNYIDWENKKCNFDSESFIEFLEFAKEFPESYPDNVWEDYKDTLYLENSALFGILSIGGFRTYSYIKDIQFGEDVSFVGYPNDLGVNNSVIMPFSRIAISSQSQYKDAAWEFVKTFLSEEYQDKLEYSFPIRKSSFEKMGEAATHKMFYMDGDKKVEYEDTYYIGGQEVVAKPLTSEDVMTLTNFIKSINLVTSNNSSVNNIIFEEASAFFSGQKSAKEVADIIQSRLSIYVNENS